MPSGSPAHLGRPRRGDEVNGVKLTPGLVRTIRAQRKGGRTLRFLADRFGITFSHVWNLCHGRSWRHLQ